jgi:streptomycin 3"-adenylyltransferase
VTVATMPAAVAVRGRSPLVGLLDPAGDRYLRGCLAVLHERLGTDLVGVYLYGSAVIGEFHPGRSDLDAVAVVARALPTARALWVAAGITAVDRPWATKGIDLAVVTADVAVSPPRSPRFELCMLTFYGSPRAGESVSGGDPRLVMNLACCRDHGIAVVGPAAAQVFGPVPRAAYLSELRAELEKRWMSSHYRVLNACRDWRYVEDGVICSKIEGARWARGRLADPWLVDAALQWQARGDGPVLDVGEVEVLLAQVVARLESG